MTPTHGRDEVFGDVGYGDSHWEDLNFDPTRSGGPIATRPDDVTINNVLHSEFTSANNQFCGAVEEIPHDAKLYTAVNALKYYPHLHGFLKASESVGTTGVEFTIYWELRDSNGTTSGSAVVTHTSAEIGANANKIDFYDETGFTASAELGSQLALTIARTGGDAGDFIVTTYGIHYEMDSPGSRGIGTK